MPTSSPRRSTTNYLVKEWKLVLDALRSAVDGLAVKAIMDETGLRARNSVDLLLGRMVSRLAGRDAAPAGL
jgi:hypothetical protein